MDGEINLDVPTRGAKMIEELQMNVNFIPPYDFDTMKLCTDEILRLHNMNADVFQQQSENQPSMSQDDMMLIMTRTHVIERLKRCCCAYLNERLNRLKELRWRHSGNITPEIKANLSPDEVVWLEDYNQMLFAYQQSFVIRRADRVVNLDVNLLNSMDPPKSILVQVKSLEDYGEYETSEGPTVVLKKNTVHLIPRRDAETLLKNRIVEYV